MVAGLMEVCARHPRKYEYLGISYLNYMEILVERALKHAGYVVVAKDTTILMGDLCSSYWSWSWEAA